MTDYTYKDETILLRYGYNNSSKAHVVLQLHGGVDDLKLFEGLDGKPFMCALIPLDYDNPDTGSVPSAGESEPSPAPSADETGQQSGSTGTGPTSAPGDDGGLAKEARGTRDPMPLKSSPGPEGLTGGQFAKELLLAGVFNQHDVLEHVGTDKAFQSWVRGQPSCVSKQAPCVYAHVRRANNSGTGIKPKYSGVPLTDDEHRLQHQKGESAICPLFDFDRKTTGDDNYGFGHRDEAREWFDKKAAWYRWDWATKSIATAHGHDSRADMEPAAWRDWFYHRDLKLPRQLR